MDHLTEKINQLKWFQAIGVEYYYSENKTSVVAMTGQANSIPSEQEKVKIQEVSRRTDEKKLSAPLPVVSCNDIVETARTLADKIRTLEELKEVVLNFNGCDLKKLANNTVFSDGNPSSPIMFIGEAPGSSEDLAGIPFCGESGKLLDHMLSSIGISRQHNAYITNTVFWRPPANRQPTQEEIDICRPFVEKHIALINPKLIVLVGSVAATCLLGKNAGITKIRREYYSYTNKYLMQAIPTTGIFHPAYLLRQPLQKKVTWYDLLAIQEYITAIIE